MSIKTLVIIGLAIMCISCNQAPAPASTQPKVEANPQAVLRVHKDGYAVATTERSADQYVQVDSVSLPSDLDPKQQYIMYEGPALENDVIGYRLYADSRHRVDIFGKSVHDLVLDTVGWHYHDVMPWGSDILKVGNSLGMGSPAIYYQDSLYTLSNNASKTITTYRDRDRSGFKMILHDLHLGQDTFTIEHTWTIANGRPHALNNLRVIAGRMPKGARFCTGIVRHEDTHYIATLNGKKALYTFGQQSYHHHEMGMAIVVDAGMATTYLDHTLSYVWLFGRDLSDVSYEIAASWQLDLQKVKSQEYFESLILQ